MLKKLMLRYLKVLKSQYQELPFGEFLKLILKSIYTCENILVYKVDINTISQELIGTTKGFQIKKGELSELEIIQNQLRPCPWEFLCYQYDGVKDFFIAQNDKGIQHISWVYYSTDRNRLLSLGVHEAEIKFCLTLSPCRGHGLYPNVIRTVVIFLEKKGCERVFMCVDNNNLSSIRGIEKAGFMRVGKIRFLKIMGLQISSQFDTSRIK